MSFEGKNWYGQYIDYSEKKKWPKGFICPYTGTIFYNIRIYSRSQVSVYRTIRPMVLCLFCICYIVVHIHVYIVLLELCQKKVSQLYYQDCRSTFSVDLSLSFLKWTCRPS